MQVPTVLRGPADMSPPCTHRHSDSPSDWRDLAPPFPAGPHSALVEGGKCSAEFRLAPYSLPTVEHCAREFRPLSPHSIFQGGRFISVVSEMERVGGTQVCESNLKTQPWL